MMRFKKIFVALIFVNVFVCNYFIKTTHAQSFGGQVLNAGGFYLDDSLWNLVLYGGTANWYECYSSGPCSYASINPVLGAHYFYVGYQTRSRPPYYSFNADVWGYGFEQNMYANDEAARQVFINQPYTVGQERWLNQRVKLWRPDGSIFESAHVSSWILDGGFLFYPSREAYYYPSQSIVSYDYARKCNNSWNFRVYDHPGITTLYYNAVANGDYIDSGLYYTNFTASFGYNGQQIASVPYSIKILLRQSSTCSSGLDGNFAWDWQLIPTPISDWANPPSGTTLP
ncbi:MAG: hypothetical protein GC154_21875 [bacterium]|nr:hypothetical protein [bacterium]